MTSQIVFDSAAVNYVQPDIAGTPEGTVTALFVDKNLSQYTTGAHGTSCTDVNGLTLWTVDEDAIEQLFIDMGAADPTLVGTSGVMLSPAGTKLIFWMQATSTSSFYLYVGVAPINAVGSVLPPVLTNYLRMRNVGSLYTAIACWEMNGPGGSLVILTRDFTNDKVQFWICPTLSSIEHGTYKGSHAGCTGTLASDQGPAYYVSWTHADAFRMGYDNSPVQDGTVSRSPVGFLSGGRFYWVLSKAWMENGGSGIAANYADDYPDGGVFYLDFIYDEYDSHVWPVGEVSERVALSTGAFEGPETFAPALPWTEEYTRLSDGGTNDGWLTSYQGRPSIIYRGGVPYLFFGVIDGNATYEDGDLGLGERIYYAKVRGYKWTGAAFQLFDTAEGTILRDGDLGYSGYNFDDPDSQGVWVYPDPDADPDEPPYQIYFQVCQWTAMGGASNSRSVLTQFGEYREITPAVRTGEALGRVRIVPEQRAG